MEAQIPKQYLQLCGQAVLLHTLKRLASCPGISGLFLGVSSGDPYWQKLSFDAPWLKRVCDGGTERSDTVSLILDSMEDMVQPQDWVLVHDAARPCVAHSDILQLMAHAREQGGGLLGRPISDTVKLADGDNKVRQTIPRDGLWRAQTPQMFRYAELRKALQDAKDIGYAITDEASAMELAGFKPLMVQGRNDNIKITVPGDLELAEVFIKAQEIE